VEAVPARSPGPTGVLERNVVALRSHSGMPSFVIRAEDLVLLNELVAEYPRPIGLAWINRGTNQKLRPSTVALLMRTLYEPIEFSDSVANLHKSAGLRVTFKCEHDRAEFAAAFQALKKML
jgi:hypothetical protein